MIDEKCAMVGSIMKGLCFFLGTFNVFGTLRWPKLRVFGEKTRFFAVFWYVCTHKATFFQICGMLAVEGCWCVHHQWGGLVIMIVVPLRESDVTQYSNAVLTKKSSSLELQYGKIVVLPLLLSFKPSSGPETNHFFGLDNSYLYCCSIKIVM